MKVWPKDESMLSAILFEPVMALTVKLFRMHFFRPSHASGGPEM